MEAKWIWTEYVWRVGKKTGKHGNLHDGKKIKVQEKENGQGKEANCFDAMIVCFILEPMKQVPLFSDIHIIYISPCFVSYYSATNKRYHPHVFILLMHCQITEFCQCVARTRKSLTDVKIRGGAKISAKETEASWGEPRLNNPLAEFDIGTSYLLWIFWIPKEMSREASPYCTYDIPLNK